MPKQVARSEGCEVQGPASRCREQKRSTEGVSAFTKTSQECCSSNKPSIEDLNCTFQETIGSQFFKGVTK